MGEGTETSPVEEVIANGTRGHPVGLQETVGPRTGLLVATEGLREPGPFKLLHRRNGRTLGAGGMGNWSRSRDPSRLHAATPLPFLLEAERREG